MSYKIKRQDSSPYYLILHHGNPVEDVKRYLSTLITLEFSKNSIRTYCYDLLELYRWLNVYGKNFKDLRKSDLYKYIAYQKLKNNSSVTINRRLLICNCYYNFIYNEDIPTDSYSIKQPGFYKGSKVCSREMFHFKKSHLKIPRLRTTKKLIESLTTDEVHSFLQSFTKYRDIAIVMFMYLCGLRSKEVIELENSNVNIIERKIKIAGKGNKERIVPLPDILIEIITKYISLERPSTSCSSKLFVILKGKKTGQFMSYQGLRRIFRYHREISKLKKANPHKMRHTFATEMVKEGMPLSVLQKILGHDSISMTEKYVHISDTDVHKKYQEIMKKKNSN